MERDAGVYLYGGLVLSSEIPLPELSGPYSVSGAPISVFIRLGKVPDTIPDAAKLDEGCYAAPSQYLLKIDGIGGYLVSDGKTIVIEPDKDAHPSDLRAYLMSTIFVVLCHQRGLLPLHASAVSARGKVAAFVAQSGDGKSSLAAHLGRRGYPVIADDICLIDAAPNQPAIVSPVAPWLKLWRASLDDIGESAERLKRVFSDEDKYRLPLTGLLEPQPIGQIIFLEKGELAFEEISRIEAIPRLMNLTHQAYLLEATGMREENFLRCGRVLSQAKAYRLARPWGLEHMKTTMEMLADLLGEAS